MASVDTTGKLWQQVVLDFRRACLLRYEGKHGESCKVLDQELSKSISVWSERSTGDSSAKREALNEMFRAEQRRIDDAVLVHKMVSKSLSHELLPSMFNVVTQEIREAVREELGQKPTGARVSGTAGLAGASRRIRFDDIGGIIDALQQEQSADYGARSIPVFT